MYSTKMGSNVKFTIFALLTITLYGGLSFAVWNLHSQSVSLKDENQNQNTELRSQITELRSLKSENANLQNQISELRGFVGANPNPHSSDEATVMDTLKRLTRQSGSSQSATDLLTDKDTSATLVIQERWVQRVLSAIPVQWGTKGLKEIWARSVNEVRQGLKASKVRKDIMVSLDTKARVAGRVPRELKEIEALEAIMDKRERKE